MKKNTKPIKPTKPKPKPLPRRNPYGPSPRRPDRREDDTPLEHK